MFFLKLKPWARQVFLFFVFTCIPLCTTLNAQNPEPEMKIDQAMNSMLDDHPYRFLIFRVMPQIHMNSGYDSNGLYAPTGELIGDYFFSVAPGGSFAFRLGSRAFVVLEERLNLVYYKELDQLRDVYNTTSARITTGSRRTLLNLYGVYFNRKTGVDSEFDIPVQQKTVFGGSDFEVALTERMDLNLEFSSGQFTYEEATDIESPFGLPPDTRQTIYGTGIDYWVHPRIAVSLGGNIREIDFLNRDVIRNSYRFYSGFRVIGPGASGRVRVGFGQTERQRGTESENLNTFVADAGMDFVLKDRATLGVSFRRSHDVSRIGFDNFRVTTEAGFRASYPINPKMYLDGSYRLGKNDYGERVDIEGVTNLNDNFHTLRTGLNYYVMRNLVVRGGVIYYRRNANFRLVEKDRVAYDIGISYVVTPFDY